MSKPKLHPMFALLVKRACQIGWPVTHKDDLTVHDRHTIETLNPECFGWLVRECGTELLLVNSTHAFQTLHYQMENTPCRAFWCSTFMGKPEMTEVTPIILWRKLRHLAHNRVKHFADLAGVADLWDKPANRTAFYDGTNAARIARDVEEQLRLKAAV